MKNKTLSPGGSWIFQCTYVQYTKGMEGPRARSRVIDTTIFHFPRFASIIKISAEFLHRATSSVTSDNDRNSSLEDNPNSDCQGNNIMDDYNNNELF